MVVEVPVPITAGSGTPIAAVTDPSGNARQVVSIGDPVDGDIAAVTSAGELQTSDATAQDVLEQLAYGLAIMQSGGGAQPPDPTGRTRVVLDAITGGLTLATVSTVTTVTTVTGVTTVAAVTKLAQMGASVVDQVPVNAANGTFGDLRRNIATT